MSSKPLVRDLFDLPDQIRKGDFVLKLTEGVTHARETVRTYVVTPALVDALMPSTRRCAWWAAPCATAAARPRSCTAASAAASRTSWPC